MLIPYGEAETMGISGYEIRSLKLEHVSSTNFAAVLSLDHVAATLNTIFHRLSTPNFISNTLV
jgi:hypothetical protein